MPGFFKKEKKKLACFDHVVKYRRKIASLYRSKEFRCTSCRFLSGELCLFEPEPINISRHGIYSHFCGRYENCGREEFIRRFPGIEAEAERIEIEGKKETNRIMGWKDE